MDTMVRTEVRHEALRIAGKKVETGARLEVRFPWDNRLVGTVPRATPELVAEAFWIAHDYKPRLTRYQRQKITIVLISSTLSVFWMALLGFVVGHYFSLRNAVAGQGPVTRALRTGGTVALVMVSRKDATAARGTRAKPRMPVAASRWLQSWM